MSDIISEFPGKYLSMDSYRFPEIIDCIIHNDKLNCDFFFVKIKAIK
jgi:hypothetical protein